MPPYMVLHWDGKIIMYEKRKGRVIVCVIGSFPGVKILDQFFGAPFVTNGSGRVAADALIEILSGWDIPESIIIGMLGSYLDGIFQNPLSLACVEILSGWDIPESIIIGMCWDPIWMGYSRIHYHWHVLGSYLDGIFQNPLSLACVGILSGWDIPESIIIGMC